MICARLHYTRGMGLQKLAEEWPVWEKLKSHAKNELADLEAKSMLLNMVVVENYKQGRGTVKSATDLGPVPVEVSTRPCSQCLSFGPCPHLVRMIDPVRVESDNTPAMIALWAMAHHEGAAEHMALNGAASPLLRLLTLHCPPDHALHTDKVVGLNTDICPSEKMTK